MKIGILTYHRAHNYGAYLQACALCNRLNMEHNVDAEIIDFRTLAEKISYDFSSGSKTFLKNPFSYKFKKELWDMFEVSVCGSFMKKSDESMISDSITDFESFVTGKYDMIIVGSDEVWKLDGIRGFPNPYWLHGDIGCRKVAYAVSSRSDFSTLSAESRNYIIESLREFEYIGVRDTVTEDEIRKVIGKDKLLRINPDPSFIYDFEVEKVDLFDFLRPHCNLDTNKKNIVVMTESKSLSEEIRAKLKKEYNLISVFHWHPGYVNLSFLNPLEWLTVLKSADMVLTSYFHATCFCIIFNTPFLSFGTEIKSLKLRELLTDARAIERYIDINTCLNKIHEVVQSHSAKPNLENYVVKCKSNFDDFISHIRGEI